jgi:hypothetical protein
MRVDLPYRGPLRQVNGVVWRLDYHAGPPSNQDYTMNVRAPWQEMKRVLLWAASSLIVLTGSVLLTGERDLTYVLLAASPFLLCLSVTALWMVWRRLTAPKWDGTALLSEEATDYFEAGRQPDKVPSEGIVADGAAIEKRDS